MNIGLNIAEETPHKTYEDGLNDAWELARKIVLPAEDGGMSFELRIKTFGWGPQKILQTYSCQEALAKMEAYDNRMRVGDVVKYNDNDNILVLVTCVRKGNFDGIRVSENSRPGSQGEAYSNRSFKDWIKTGRHIDLSSLLAEAGE